MVITPIRLKIIYVKFALELQYLVNVMMSKST